MAPFPWTAVAACVSGLACAAAAGTGDDPISTHRARTVSSDSSSLRPVGPRTAMISPLQAAISKYPPSIPRSFVAAARGSWFGTHSALGSVPPRRSAP